MEGDERKKKRGSSNKSHSHVIYQNLEGHSPSSSSSRQRQKSSGSGKKVRIFANSNFDPSKPQPNSDSPSARGNINNGNGGPTIGSLFREMSNGSMPNLLSMVSNRYQRKSVVVVLSNVAKQIWVSPLSPLDGTRIQKVVNGILPYLTLPMLTFKSDNEGGRRSSSSNGGGGKIDSSSADQQFLAIPEVSASYEKLSGNASREFQDELNEEKEQSEKFQPGQSSEMQNNDAVVNNDSNSSTKPFVSLALNCQNVYEIEAAMKKGTMVIHVKNECNALKYQASHVGHHLRRLQIVGILSSVLGIILLYSLRRKALRVQSNVKTFVSQWLIWFITWVLRPRQLPLSSHLSQALASPSNAILINLPHRRWIIPFLFATASTATAFSCTLRHYLYTRATMWKQCVDYQFIQIPISDPKVNNTDDDDDDNPDLLMMSGDDNDDNDDDEFDRSGAYGKLQKEKPVFSIASRRHSASSDVHSSASSVKEPAIITFESFLIREDVLLRPIPSKSAISMLGGDGQFSVAKNVVASSSASTHTRKYSAWQWPFYSLSLGVCYFFGNQMGAGSFLASFIFGPLGPVSQPDDVIGDYN